MYKGGNITKTDENQSSENAFIEFIRMSRIEHVFYGSTSVNIKYRYMGEHSPYKSADIDTLGRDVTVLLVKIVVMDNMTEEVRFSLAEEGVLYTTIYPPNYETSEPAKQREIYGKTRHAGAICPAIVYDGIMPEENANITLNDLFKSPEGFKDTDVPMEDLEEIVEDLTLFVQNGRKLGIIAMEFADGYVSMEELIYGILIKPRDEGKKDDREISERISCIIMAAAFLIIDLMIETDYTQGDFHAGNIFFKVLRESETPYFPGGLPFPELSYIANLKPLFIDFGQAIKVAHKHDFYKDLKSRHAYRQILGNIFLEGPSKIFKDPKSYGWISGVQKKLSSKASREEYSAALNSDMAGLTFFKNPYGNSFEDPGELRFLNDNFDGENGIMSNLYKAREIARELHTPLKESGFEKSALHPIGLPIGLPPIGLPPVKKIGLSLFGTGKGIKTRKKNKTKKYKNIKNNKNSRKRKTRVT